VTESMRIFTRCQDMLIWLLPKAERFPRVYRHTLTQRIMDAALDVQGALYDAQSQGGSTRYKHLREADAALGKLRSYLRLIHQWHWINDSQYLHISSIIAEVGRLLVLLC